MIVDARSDAIAAGEAALSAARWTEARIDFEKALEYGDCAAAWEGLGAACWWLEDSPATVDAHVKAYRRYRDGDDRPGAARMAVALAWDHFLAGDHAVASGWLSRAERLLDGLVTTAEQGTLAIANAHFAMFIDHDAATAERHAANAMQIGKTLGNIDIEMLALAYHGLSAVSQGHVRDGMRMLDEATTAAAAGEIGDLDAAASTCCCLIYACERVRDFDRAAQWCRRVQALCERWSYQLMFSLCRTHYAGVLIWRGDWRQADIELRTAIKDLERSRPGETAEALVKLAELRYRQGRVVEAEALLTRAESPPSRMLARVLAMPVRAHLALAGGDALTGADYALRFLRAVQAEARMERVTGLDLLVRAHLALGDRSAAEAAAAEMSDIADDVGTDPLLAASAVARGLIAAENGDHDVAKRSFEDALTRFEGCGAPYEAATTRVELADSLNHLGRREAATRFASVARDEFRRLGAIREVERACAILEEIVLDATRTGVSDPAGLTRREIEVLRLVAQGMNNQEIAERLVLSVRTVERHLSNVYDKLGTGGRVARAAAATYALGQHLE